MDRATGSTAARLLAQVLAERVRDEGAQEPPLLQTPETHTAPEMLWYPSIQVYQGLANIFGRGAPNAAGCQVVVSCTSASTGTTSWLPPYLPGASPYLAVPTAWIPGGPAELARVV